MQKKGDKIRYGLLKGAWKLFSLIPLPILYGLSDLLFYPLYYIGRYRRKITRKNLTESFPEKSKKEIAAIEKRFYHFFTDLIFEICKFATISEKEIRKRMRFINIEEINAVLQQGKSMSVYLGHQGNWEWISSLPLHLHEGVVAGQIYQKLHDRLTNQLLLDNRGRLGAVSVEMKETLRWINGQMQNQVVTITGYIADQSPRRKSKVQQAVRFLNHSTPALTGTEKITKKYGYAAYYADVVRTRRGYYEVRMIPMCEQPQSLPDYELTEMYFGLLEQTIRKHPECYLWTHNRFKHPATHLLREMTLNQQNT
jgi:KDO2-lipid IV(A) lauroyltransferase